MTKISMIIGYFAIVFANIVGIGYFLYLWGANDIAIGLAAWTAFKVWGGMIVGGIFALVIGYILD